MTMSVETFSKSSACDFVVILVVIISRPNSFCSWVAFPHSFGVFLGLAVKEFRSFGAAWQDLAVWHKSRLSSSYPWEDGNWECANGLACIGFTSMDLCTRKTWGLADQVSETRPQRRSGENLLFSMGTRGRLVKLRVWMSRAQ